MPATALALNSNAASDEAQFFAFHDQIPEVDREKPRYNCTAEYLKKHRPDVYQAALDMLVEPGISIRSICRTLHLSHHTLSSLQERESGNLATRKKVVLNTVTRGLRLCAERVEELAPEMSARDALIGVGILGEKMQLLGGEATARVEIGRAGNIFEEFRRFSEQIEKMANARVVESEALDNGLGPENSGANSGVATEPSGGWANEATANPGERRGPSGAIRDQHADVLHETIPRGTVGVDVDSAGASTAIMELAS